MTAADDNVALLKEAYSQWSAQDSEGYDCWMAILAEEVSLGSLANGAPEMPFTAPRRSKAQVLDYLDELKRDWDMISFDMNDYIVEGDRVVAIGRVVWRNKATGKVVDTPKVDIWRFRDGKAVDFQEFYDTALAYAATKP